MRLTPEYKTRPSAREHRITVMREQSVNESGSNVVKPVPVGNYWASVAPLSERMRTQYQSISVAATHTITVGGKIDVKESDKIKFNGRDFDILTIKDADENRRDKVIITQEIRPGQKK